MGKPSKPSAERLLACNLKHFRVARGWSQLQLAEEAGLSRRLIEMMEGGTANPSLKNLEKVAIAFHVEMAELFVPRDDRGR